MLLFLSYCEYMDKLKGEIKLSLGGNKMVNKELIIRELKRLYFDVEVNEIDKSEYIFLMTAMQ